MKNKYTGPGRQWWLLVLWALGIALPIRAQTTQPPVIQWQRLFPGAAEFFTPAYIAKASDGQIGVVTSNHDLIKLSGSGDVLWTTRLLAQNVESGQKIRRPTGLAPTRDGGFVVLGDDRVGWFIRKFNANGGTVWTKKVVDYDGNSQEHYEDQLIQTIDGGFLVTGTRRYQRTYTSTFVTKFDQDGGLTWEREVRYSHNMATQDNGLTSTKGILSLPDGGYVLVGFTSENSFGSWVARLDSQGQVIWQNKYNSNASLDDVILSPFGDGSYITVGYVRPPGSFIDRTDIFTIKPNGDFTNTVSIPNSSQLANAGFQASIASAQTTSGEPSYVIFDHGYQTEAALRLTSIGSNNQVRWTKLLGGESGGAAQGIIATDDGYVAVGLQNSGTGVTKLVQTPLFVLTSPTYNCQTGVITFNTTGGDGSPITYSAPGISRANPTDNTGTVEQGLRNDPKPITITATQSGISVTYVFDLKAACNDLSATPKPPVLVRPIANQTLVLGQPIPAQSIDIGSSFVDPTANVPGYQSSWVIQTNGLPTGISPVATDQNLSIASPRLFLGGTPTTTGVYTLTVIASTAFFPNQPVVTTFTITVVDKPVDGSITLLAPTYNCQTGAITFNTSGGNGSPIVYSAPGITRTNVTDNFGTVEQGLRNDPKPITITATQSGASSVFTFDLKAACNSTTNPGAPSPIGGTIPDRTLTTNRFYIDFIIGGGYYNPADPYNYLTWGFSASGLPPGMAIYTGVSSRTYFSVQISGSPTTVGTYPVTVQVVNPRFPNDPPYKTSFTITVVNDNPTTLSLQQPTYDCQTGAFTFNTSGGDDSPIEFQAIGITGWTTNPNQFVDRESRTASDVKPFTLMARQNGQVVTYTWDLKAACGRGAGRLRTAEPERELSVSVLGNPVVEQVRVVVRGAEGKPLRLSLSDARGRLLENRFVERAGSAEEQAFEVGQQAPGLLLLRTTTDTQTRTIKIIKR